MQFLFTPVFFLCLVFSAFAAPIPGNGTALDAVQDSAGKTKSEPIFSVLQTSGPVIVELFVYESYSRVTTPIPPEDMIKLRNAVEILLPWFVPLLRHQNEMGALYNPLPAVPDPNLSFRVATLHWNALLKFQMSFVLLLK
ncbi:hypothetical protein EV360DRAFT_75500 [Lentinula raphanica]|nr:hypothetical protein EV360DRAFT_75500 [Lentinula raphanica]